MIRSPVQDLYLSPLFNKTNEQCQGDPTLGPGGTAEFTRTRTRTPSHDHAHTHSHALAVRQSVQSILGGGIPCSLRPRRRETSRDAPPFLEARTPSVKSITTIGPRN